MREYDLFVPLRHNDGTPVEREKLNRLRQRLVERFGGLTDFSHRNEGVWKVGNVTFRDEIVIYRMLAEEESVARQFFALLKEEMKEVFRQQDVLIVEREIRIL